jgi:arsenate reductase
MRIKIIHNPRCSKSRQTLQLLKDQGLDPTIIDYLKHPLTTKQLEDILQKLAIQPRDLIRQQEVIYKTLGLANPTLSADQLIQAMVNHPKLIERPIVLINDKAAIGRPPENVLNLLAELT